MFFQGCLFCGCTCNHQLIDWMQVNNLKVFLLVFIKICFSSVGSNKEIEVLVYKYYHQKRHIFGDILLSMFD